MTASVPSRPPGNDRFDDAGEALPADLPPPTGPTVYSRPPPSAPTLTHPAEPTSAGASHPPPSPRRGRGSGGGGPAELDPRPGRIPGLDGIRAIAIIAVLIYHFTPNALPGGFIGVDVFFVLSGFLITTLLLRDVATHGRLRLGRFWVRRARRLVPPLVTVVVVSIVAARMVGGDLLVGIGRQVLGALTFTTNWLEIGAGTSYFHHTSPLLFVNFWSLAVEEQFYLLWPLVLGVVLALTVRARQRVAVALSLAAGSALLMALLYEPGSDATRVYYGADTHVFGLMLGAALAFAWAGPGRAGLLHPLWQRWRGLAVIASLAVLILLMRVLTDTSAWTLRGGLLLACLATAVLIAALLERGGPWRSLMQARPIGWLGSRSYGIYLWHWPVLTILGALVPYAAGTTRGTVVLLSALTITLVLSELSFRVIETPVRRYGFRQSLRRVRAWVGTPWHASRTPRIVAGLIVAALLMTLIAVLTAPDRSETQRSIEESEARLSGTQIEGSAGDPVGAPDSDGAEGAAEDVAAEEAGESGTQTGDEAAAESDGRDGSDGGGQLSADRFDTFVEDDDGLLVPPGDAITAIGDSLVVTSADGLTYRFPEINYSAQSNRQWGDALPVLDEALDEGTVRENVVVHFGTNAGVDEDSLREFIDALGPERNIVLMNLYSRSTFVPGSNDVIDDVAADHPNVVVGDWNAAATEQPHTLQSDGIHPDIEGMHVYAEVVAESFDALARSAD